MKPELTHSESDISDHTKDLQKNLIRQIHEDMINEPTMNINPDTSDTSDTKSWLDHRISESIQVITWRTGGVFFFLYYHCFIAGERLVEGRTCDGAKIQTDRGRQSVYVVWYYG